MTDVNVPASLSPTDHDGLVTLIANFGSFTKQYTQDIKEIKENVNGRLIGHDADIKANEMRITALEKLVTETNPIEAFKSLSDLKAEYHDDKTKFNTYRVVGGIVGGAIMWVITQLPNILRGWGL